MSNDTTTFLKNDQNCLPIDSSKITRIAVVGKLAKQLQFDKKSIFSILRKATNLEVKMTYTNGHLDTNEVNETVMNEAQRAASIADVVIIFIGYLEEEKRREATTLPTPQNVLVDVVSQVEKNVVVVVLANAKVKMPWKKQVKSILQITEFDKEVVNLLFKN